MTADVRSTIETWYDFVLQQLAAESYFEGVDLTTRDEVATILINGKYYVVNTAIVERTGDEIECDGTVAKLNPVGSIFCNRAVLPYANASML